jgi:hypothetical protein
MASRMRFKNGITSALWWTPLVAALVVLPYARRGTSNGDDITFHIDSWIEVVRQWKTGILYPHWAAFANYGSGEPRFIFYPPFSWMGGALLGLALPWQIVPGTFCALVCIAAGLSMYLLAREWLDEDTAVLAAAFYAVNPYQLVLIYQRAAFGELLSSIWLPGIMLFALRERGTFWRNALLLALPLSAVWLTNLPTAVISSYLLAFVVIVRAIQQRSITPLLRAAVAMGFALGLASFYLVPAIYEQRWVQIGQAVGLGARPQDNFLFGGYGDVPHDQALHRLSIFASIEFFAGFFFAWASRSLQRISTGLYRTFVGILVLSAFLMFPLSNPLWNHAPKLMFVQFPWRWLLVFNLALTLLIAFAMMRKARTRWLAFIAIPALIFGMNWKFQQPIYPEDKPVALAEAIEDGTGYEGTDEYAPQHSDRENLEANAPQIAIQLDTENEEQRTKAPSSLAHSTIRAWEAERKRITIDSRIATRNTLRLLDYPAWRVTVDGEKVQPEFDDTTGRIALELPEGHHEIAIDYTQTQDHVWGATVSAIVLTIWLVASLVDRRRAAKLPADSTIV